MYNFIEIKPQGNKIYSRVGQKSVDWFIHGVSGSWSSTEKLTGLALVLNVKTIDELKQRTIDLFEYYEKLSPEIIHDIIAKNEHVPDTDKTFIFVKA